LFDFVYRVKEACSKRCTVDEVEKSWPRAIRLNVGQDCLLLGSYLVYEHLAVVLVVTSHLVHLLLYPLFILDLAENSLDRTPRKLVLIEVRHCFLDHLFDILWDFRQLGLSRIMLVFFFFLLYGILLLLLPPFSLLFDVPRP
jgi:hypothetical protein